MREDLVAPCGMNCATCSAYLAYSKGLQKKRGAIIHCTGCRPRNKRCAYLKGNCDLIGKGTLTFCGECKQFPCYRLRHIDARYQRDYNVSFIENLRHITQHGIKDFLETERLRHRCERCGGIVCIHNRKCYNCDHVETWRG